MTITSSFPNVVFLIAYKVQLTRERPRSRRRKCRDRHTFYQRKNLRLRPAILIRSFFFFMFFGCLSFQNSRTWTFLFCLLPSRFPLPSSKGHPNPVPIFALWCHCSVTPARPFLRSPHTTSVLLAASSHGKLFLSKHCFSSSSCKLSFINSSSSQMCTPALKQFNSSDFVPLSVLVTVCCSSLSSRF